MHKFIGVGAIRELHVHRVPFQLLVHADGDVSQQDNFRQMGGVIGEIRARGFAAPAGVEKFLPSRPGK